MKRITSLVIVLAVLLGSITTVFAADYDLVNQVDASKTFSWNEFSRVPASTRYVVDNVEDYLFEYGGELYRVNELDEATKDDTPFDEAIAGLEPVEKPIEGLKVVEVSAINANYVVVKITAPAEDLLAQEVEVKDANGNVIAVKPLDIAAGDETAEFEFVTAVKDEDLKGVWTVNGQPYDLDLFNNLEAFLDANNQLELNAALVALGIENVDAANMPDYFKEQQKLTVTAEELTVADVQKLVDDVNAAAVSKEDEVALVEAIVDAVNAENQITTLQALEDAGIAPLNSDWVAEYMAGFDADKNGSVDGTDPVGLDTIAAGATLEDVQDIIDALNDALVTDNITTDGIDKAKLTDSKALIETYATVDEGGNYVDAQFDTDIEDINVQLALVEVLEATTPTAFKNKLTALADLVDDPTQLNMDDYVDANGKAYIAALKAAKDVNKDTVAKVEGILFSYTLTNSDPVDNVNLVESTKLVDKVTGATTADELVTALNNLGVKQVAATNKAAYLIFDADSPADGPDYKDITDKDTAQAFVDAVNVDEVQNATVNTIIAKLNVFGIDNVVAANAQAYVTDSNSDIAGINADATGDNAKTVKAVKDAVDAVNKQVIVDTQVDAINEADDVATVKAALDALADVDEVADYLKIRSVDRDFVAAYVLENRPDGGYVAGTGTVLDAIDEEVTNAQTAYDAALTAVNGISIDSSIDTIVAALEGTLDEGFNALSNTEKVNAAEAFYDKLVFNDLGAIKTPFITLADVKALL